MAAAALRDLEAVDEVGWNGSGDAATLTVRVACRCENSGLRGWHEQVIAAAEGEPLLARFAVNPLVESAWHETAERRETRKGPPASRLTAALAFGNEIPRP